MADFGLGDFTDYTPDPSAYSMGDEFGFTPETFSAGLNPGDDMLGGAFGGGLGDIFKLLGLGLGGAGIAGSLFGGGASQQPNMSTPQRAALNQQQQMASGMAGTQGQLFNQGAGMLGALGQGQIPPGLQALVQKAYDPFVQNAGTQAIEASRRAGFALPQDAFTGGPGGAVMGPMMAQLPGQEANTTLNTMFPLIQMLMGQGQQGLQGLQASAGAFPYGQQTNPSAAQRIQGTAPFLQGMGNILNPPQQQKAPFDLASLMGQQ